MTNKKNTHYSLFIFVLLLHSMTILQSKSLDLNNIFIKDSTIFNFQNLYYSIESNTFNFQSYESSNSLKAITYDAKSIKLRRKMLEWHQVTGFLTWFSWLATNVAGERAEKSYHKEFEPYARAMLVLNPMNDTSQSYLLYQFILHVSPWDSSDSQHREHVQLAYTTVSLYAVTAGLAFLSPTPVNLDREPGWSTIFTHKSMILIHLPSMLALPFLGAKIHQGGPEAVQRMQYVGWTGFSALSIAIATFYF